MEHLKRNQIFQVEYELLDKASQLIETGEFDNNPLYAQYTGLLQGYAKLLQQSGGLVNISDKQQERLYKLQSDLKNLLDHTGQGIFTVNPELMVHKGCCSSECRVIFGQKIEGEKFLDLIRQFNDVEKIKLIESVLNPEFFKEDAFRQRVMLLLLPDELKINEKIYGIKYKPIRLEFKEKLENAFMIILTDITEKKILRKTMDDEKRVFKTTAQIISNLKPFSGCIREYRNFYQCKLPGLIHKEPSDLSQVINELFREVHTLKGNFAIFEIPWLVDFLEEVEHTLSVARDNLARISFSEFHRLIQRFDFEGALDESLRQIYRVIGDQWELEDDFVIVKTDDIKALAYKMEKADPGLAAEITKICEVNILELLRTYPEYTQRLAERLGKTIATFIIECPEEIKVEPERYVEFTRALVHVFRNMADHGIETAEERFASGKNEIGTIRCSVEKEGQGFRISIADDGRGINVEKLKQKAVECGVITAENACRMTIEQAVQLAFMDGISTSDAQNGISGRGAGLAKLKYETERLGGTIEVHTKIGEGTKFVFHLK